MDTSAVHGGDYGPRALSCVIACGNDRMGGMGTSRDRAGGKGGRVVFFFDPRGIHTILVLCEAKVISAPRGKFL